MVLALIAILFCLTAQPAQAYLHLTFSVGSTPTPLKWDAARVRWFATDRGAPGVSASQFQTAVASAFGTWEAVPTASIAFQFAGFTAAVPFEDDGISVFGFEDEPELDRVLGATTLRGRHPDAARLSNRMSSSTPSSRGRRRRRGRQGASICSRWRCTRSDISSDSVIRRWARPRFDPKAGAACSRRAPSCSRSRSGRGVTEDRTLQPDDIAGVSDLYPDGDFRDRTGAVAGRVVRNGNGVIGAHIVAFDPKTRRARRRVLARRGRRLSDRGTLARRPRHSRGAAGRCRCRQLLFVARHRRGLPGHLSPATRRRARGRRQRTIRRRGAAQVNSSCVACRCAAGGDAGRAARAQTTEPPLRRLELAAGIGFLGGAPLGDADADLRSGTLHDPYRLFTTSSRVLGATGRGPARGLRSLAPLRIRGACAVRPSGGAHDRGERRRRRSHDRRGRAARSLSDRRRASSSGWTNSV